MKNCKIMLPAAVLFLLHSAGVNAVSEPRDNDVGEPPVYSVNCKPGTALAYACEVDAGTFKGWKVYHSHCRLCHGRSATGSPAAPSLVDRLGNADVDYGRFTYVVTHGYTGDVGGMPGWEENQEVMENMDNLYRYLRARADKVLPRGRLKQ
jgi:hypothetical protein